MGLFKYDVSLEGKRGFLSHVIFFAVQGQIDLSPEEEGQISFLGADTIYEWSLIVVLNILQIE